jgi:hypothetical protein
LSLSQLLARQGKLEEARDALRPIYSWFTEGFDVPVMVRSKKLLDELDAKAARSVASRESSGSTASNRKRGIGDQPLPLVGVVKKKGAERKSGFFASL